VQKFSKTKKFTFGFSEKFLSSVLVLRKKKNSKMNNSKPVVLSREYLQSIPLLERQAEKEQFFETIYRSTSHGVVREAKAEKTFYVFDWYNYMHPRNPKFTLPTTEEMINYFESKFPECKITKEEMLVQHLGSTKTVIVIDWS